MTPFGKHENRTLEDLGRAAVQEALAESGWPADRLDLVIGSNVLGGGGAGQRVLEGIGLLGQPVVNVENACASGSTAVHMARCAVEHGAADAVLVVGVEKMTGLFQGGIQLDRTDRPTLIGLTMPAIYALWAQRYCHVHQVDPVALAVITVKNRAYGALNPLALFQKEVTAEEVLQSRPVADPLTLLQCCANSDGAAAVVVLREELVESGVVLLGSGLASGRPMGPDLDLARSRVSADAAKAAYGSAGIEPSDVDVAEIHDAFTIGEVMSTEALGLAGEGRTLVDGARVPVNVSGGLLSKGHPVGATGVAQVVELVRQLRGEFGDRGVPGAAIAVAHTVGGGVGTLEAIASGVVVLGS